MEGWKVGRRWKGGDGSSKFFFPCMMFFVVVGFTLFYVFV